MKTVSTSARQTARSRRICAMFGIHADETHDPAHEPAFDPPLDPARSDRVLIAARGIDRLLPPGRIALVTGPSGGGKSCLLRAIERVIRERCGVVVRAGPDPAGEGAQGEAVGASPIVNLFGRSSQTALRWLSRVGLAEPALFPLCADELSDGQRSRLTIALALSRAERWNVGDHTAPATVLLDEFASSLDLTSAAALAGALRRCAARTGIRIVCAAARDEVLEPLAPEVLALVPLAGEIRVCARAPGGGA